MPLTTKPKDPLSVWSAASWMLGIPLLLGFASMISGGFFGIGIPRPLMLMGGVGIALSAVDGLRFLRGEDPHGKGRDGGIDVRTLPQGENGSTYVVVDKRPSGGRGAPKPKELGPLAYTAYFLGVQAPMFVGDLLLTGGWRGLAHLTGRRAQKSVSGTLLDTDFDDSGRLRTPE